jgi:ABC-2 type transport system ATP-binding protein
VPISLSTSAAIEPDPRRRLELIAGWTELPELVTANQGESGILELCAHLIARGVGIEAGLLSLADARAFVAAGIAKRCVRVLVEPLDANPDVAVEHAAAIEQVLVDAGVGLEQVHHGDGLATWRVMERALARGHGIRIGLEDTTVLPDGRQAADNAELVRTAAAMLSGHMRNGGDAGSAVAADSLSVIRGGNEVLHGLSFTVPRGGITGLLGPSGCGKTTLMRSVVGVQIIASGGIDVLGVPAGSPELRPRVGYVTQAPSVYGDITVGENLRYFARVLGADAARVDQVLSAVALHEHDRVANKLSGGQRSRISLATALLGDPDLLVLDEPTVGLDPVLRQELWRTFASLAEAGTTLLVSSHVMDEAERCDSLLLMRDGDLLATETPDELRSRTGQQDLEEAFLALIREQEAA